MPLKPRKTGEEERQSGKTERDVAMFDGPLGGGAIVLGEPAHHRVFPLAGALREEETGEHGRDQDGEDKRAEQREAHHPGHRLEESAFHCLQREDGQVRGDDDAACVEDGALDLVRGLADLLRRSNVLPASLAEMADDVLDHHDRAVDHHAEIQRAERKQIGREFRADSRQMAAKSSANGMVRATMKAPRTLPRKRKRMMTTRMMPSVRLWSTVWVV